MKLYYDPLSTTSRPIAFFLADEGIPLQHERLSLFAGENLSPAFTAVNPNQMVPVLVEEGFRLDEASAILKYLAESVGSAAYPSATRARARVNAAMDWFNTQWLRDVAHHLVYPQVLPPDHLPPMDVVATVTYGCAQAQRWLGVLDRHMLGDAPFVCGDRVSLADYMGGAYVTLTELVGFDLAPWPNVVRWIETLKRRPGWRPANAAFDGWVASHRARNAVASVA